MLVTTPGNAAYARSCPLDQTRYTILTTGREKAVMEPCIWRIAYAETVLAKYETLRRFASRLTLTTTESWKRLRLSHIPR